MVAASHCRKRKLRLRQLKLRLFLAVMVPLLLPDKMAQFGFDSNMR